MKLRVTEEMLLKLAKTTGEKEEQQKTGDKH